MDSKKIIYFCRLFYISAIICGISAVSTENESTEMWRGEVDDANRVYGGEPTSVSSLVMVMESVPYYQWKYIFTGLILTNTCALIRARGIVDTNKSPATLIPNLYRTVWVPRPGCDIQYHIREISLNTPGYNFPTREHDIAIAKVQRPIYFGDEVCDGPSVHPQWISCDADGPPPNYRDCFFASYGLNYALGDNPVPLAPEFISPNKTRVKILSAGACEERRLEREPDATVYFVPKDQVCISTINNHSPTCDEDQNGVLICKYWHSPHHGNGWGNQPGHAHGWTSTSNHAGGGGWKQPSQRSGGWSNQNNWVIVGHRTYGFGEFYCQSNSAALALKFGSPTYRDLFTTCDFKCSNNLPTGFHCKGNPSPSLGPVYCIPEKD